MSVPFTYRPDWAGGVLERLEFRTDIMVAYRGEEQRRSVRRAPRRIVEFDVTLADDERRAMEVSLWGNGAQIWLVPLWFDGQQLQADAAIGSTTVSVQTDYRDFEVGQPAIVIANHRTFEEVTISGKTGTTLTLSAPLTNAWPSGSVIYPARIARLEDRQGLSRFTGQVSRTRVRFRLLEAADNVTATEENLLIGENDFSLWTKFTTIAGSANVTVDDAIAPDGTLTADLVEFYNGFGSSAYLTQRVTDDGSTKSRSIWMKSQSATDAGSIIDVFARDTEIRALTAVTLTEEWQQVALPDVTLSAGTDRELLSFGLLSTSEGNANDVDVHVHVWGAKAFTPLYGNFNGYPVLDARPNWSQAPQLDYERKLSVLDAVVGNVIEIDESGLPVTRQRFGYTFPDRADAQTFREFVYSVRGRLGAFYLPTFTEDLRLTADAAAGDTTLNVALVTYSGYIDQDPGRDAIRIALSGGAVVYAKITASTVLDADTEQLTISPAIPVAVTSANLECISFMPLVRFDADAVEFNWWTGEVAETSMMARTFRHGV